MVDGKTILIMTCNLIITNTAEYLYRDSPLRYLAQQLILGQKVKGQGQRVTNWKNTLKAIEP